MMDTHLPSSDATVSTLLSRASTGDLHDPAPSPAELGQIVAAALRAPDHGRLRPWRFQAIRGEARHRFADLCIEALRARDSTATEAEATRMRGKITGAPLILVLGMHPTDTPKVPETEQVQSVAAAAMNALNAAHAMGFAGKWVTGPNAYDPAVARGLGYTAPDRVLGFLYLGTPADTAIPAKRPDVEAYFHEWNG